MVRPRPAIAWLSYKVCCYGYSMSTEARIVEVSLIVDL